MSKMEKMGITNLVSEINVRELPDHDLKKKMVHVIKHGLRGFIFKNIRLR